MNLIQELRQVSITTARGVGIDIIKDEYMNDYDKCYIILQCVCDYFKVDWRLIKDKTRARDVVIPRQFYQYFVKQYTNLSLKKIGQETGGRDHSSVIHSLNEVKEKCEVEKKYRETFENLEKYIKLGLGIY